MDDTFCRGLLYFCYNFDSADAQKFCGTSNNEWAKIKMLTHISVAKFYPSVLDKKIRCAALILIVLLSTIKLVFSDASMLTVYGLSPWVFKSSSPSETCLSLVLVDPQGRRTGHNPKKQETLNEIPKSSHGEQGIDDDETGERGARSKVIWIGSPLQGLYTLEIFGTKAGIYIAEIDSSDSKGNSITNKIGGFIKNNEQQKVKIYFTPSSLYQSNTITKEVSLPLLKEQVDAAINCGILNDKALNNDLRGLLKTIGKSIKYNRKSQAKKDLQNFIEKASYAMKRQDEGGAHSQYSVVLDILVNDARNLFEKF